MILLVDNYDSFSFNLVQMIGGFVKEEEIKAIRNDEYTVDEILAMKPSHIILSPGPGKPADAGVMEELIAKAYDKVPVLGVCLGHQAICEALGGKVTYARQLMHGKQSEVTLEQDSEIFKSLPKTVKVARYHSLVADSDKIPDCLKITARDEKGEVMAVQHKNYPVFGLQFHPESIMTPNGKEMVQAFLEL